jgi:hypothetical protein
MTTPSEQEMIEGMSRGWAALESFIVRTLQEERAQIPVRLPSVEPEPV